MTCTRVKSIEKGSYHDFGLLFSVTKPVYRNVNDEESSLSIGLELIYISYVSSK